MATPRRKVVVARNLGPDVMSLLNDHPELEVSSSGGLLQRLFGLLKLIGLSSRSLLGHMKTSRATASGCLKTYPERTVFSSCTLIR